MNIRKLTASVCTAALLATGSCAQLARAEAPAVTDVPVAKVATAERFNTSTVINLANSDARRNAGPDVGLWQCGNGDAAGGELPFLGDWGLNGLWGHISVKKNGSGLILENNGSDGNPAVIRYTLGGDHLGHHNKSGAEIPTDSYLNVKITANQKFNIVIPYRYGSVSEASASVGFLTLRNENGKLTAVNSEQGAAYSTLLDAGTYEGKLYLKDVLKSTDGKAYSTVRLYALDYMTDPQVKAFKTDIEKLTVDTDMLDFVNYTRAGVNGEWDMGKWYKDQLEGQNYWGHQGWAVNPLGGDSMKVEKEGSALKLISNNGGDFARLKFAGWSFGHHVSELKVGVNSYLNFNIESDVDFRIAVHFVVDQVNDPNEHWKFRTLYLTPDGDKLSAIVEEVTDNMSSYYGNEIPAGNYKGYGIDLKSVLSGDIDAVKSAQIFGVSVWTRPNTDGKVVKINELSIGNAKGDVYTDDEINILDLVKAKKLSVNNAYSNTADFDKSGAVEAADLITLRKLILEDASGRKPLLVKEKVRPVNVLNFTDIRNPGPDRQINSWQCGNGDAPNNPFSGQYGLGPVWGHISVNRTDAGLIIKNNGSDGNPAVLRYTLGGEQLTHPGMEIPVDTVLNIKATTNQKFNIIMPFRYGSVEEKGEKEVNGFITLKVSDGKLTVVNSTQDVVYNSFIDAGKIDISVSLKDILTTDGVNNYTKARIYAIDYITDPDVRPYETVFEKFSFDPVLKTEK